MDFEHLQDVTVETSDEDEDDETLLVFDIVLSDGAHSAMNTTRKPKPDRRATLLVAIAISSFIFVSSVVVVGIFAAKQRTRNQMLRAAAQNNTGRATPSPSLSPSSEPSAAPSAMPSASPSKSSQPSVFPTLQPSSIPSLAPSVAAQQNTTVFYAVGDAPYTNDQAITLLKDVLALPPDGDFLIHLGDLRKAGEACQATEYRRAAAILQESTIPVFVVIGDNDWNDCPDVDNGFELWKNHFLKFDSLHWDVPWAVERQKGREENFAFEHKGTLFIGLNLVGGEVHSTKEWKDRLNDQEKWTIKTIKEYVSKKSEENIGRIVMFGHADPSEKHAPFFDPIRKFIEKDLENKVPFLYMNGDSHQWSYDRSFMGEPSLLRIMVTGRSVDPPLRISVEANGDAVNSTDAFLFDRRLEERNI